MSPLSVMCFSATDVQVERRVGRHAAGHDESEDGSDDDGRCTGRHDTTPAGKLAAPCGPQARAQRGPGPPLLPGKVRSHGSDRCVCPSVMSVQLHFCAICWDWLAIS